MTGHRGWGVDAVSGGVDAWPGGRWMLGRGGGGRGE